MSYFDGLLQAHQCAAATLLLETRRHAEKRGANIYAELAGFSLTNDGHHMTAPRPDALASSRAMREAVQRAGLTMDEIEAISAHGSSTSLNDATETYAIKQAFGEDKARRTPIFATKGMHAHALGATGAYEAALSCLAIRHGILPGTANRITPDPDCDLDYIVEGPRPYSKGPILSNSFGFGGINACLVFKPA